MSELRFKTSAAAVSKVSVTQLAQKKCEKRRKIRHDIIGWYTAVITNKYQLRDRRPRFVTGRGSLIATSVTEFGAFSPIITLLLPARLGSGRMMTEGWRLKPLSKPIDCQTSYSNVTSVLVGVAQADSLGALQRTCSLSFPRSDSSTMGYGCRTAAQASAGYAIEKVAMLLIPRDVANSYGTRRRLRAGGPCPRLAGRGSTFPFPYLRPRQQPQSHQIYV